MILRAGGWNFFKAGKLWKQRRGVLFDSFRNVLDPGLCLALKPAGLSNMGGAGSIQVEVGKQSGGFGEERMEPSRPLQLFFYSGEFAARQSAESGKKIEIIQ